MRSLKILSKKPSPYKKLHQYKSKIQIRYAKIISSQSIFILYVFKVMYIAPISKYLFNHRNQAQTPYSPSFSAVRPYRYSPDKTQTHTN